MLVVPRLAWPSWRWMTLSGTPSPASSTAWHCAADAAQGGASHRPGPRPDGTRPAPGARPGPSARGGVNDAEQRSDRPLDASGEPGRQLLPAPGVHADLAPTAALAPPREQRSPPRIEVALAQCEWFLDAQSAAPEHHDQRPQASAVVIVGGLAHHRDDLLHGRRVGGIELPVVAWRATGVVGRHGRGRAPPTGGIEHSRDGHGISSQSHSRQGPPLYQRRRVPERRDVGDGALSLRLGAHGDARVSIRSGRRRLDPGDARIDGGSETETPLGSAGTSHVRCLSMPRDTTQPWRIPPRRDRGRGALCFVLHHPGAGETLAIWLAALPPEQSGGMMLRPLSRGSRVA